ncbi:nucleoside hydrolase [candidate division KSB1 bacterium]|nr:nucleoside hydrolase [candidate division KSB1 bacterium]RQW00644.1 MAG: nucleoside hydrolase [candidate division KSB1 bacterium]
MRIQISFLLIGVVAFLSCTPSLETSSTAKIRVILDTDANNELDDQHAIAYLLLNGTVFDVDGITVNATRNGGDINEHAAEAERIVRLCNVFPKIKVYKGANGSFEEIQDKVDSSDFDGVEAVNYIINKAHEQASGTLVLLPVGKLTNIALALKKDPSIVNKVRIVWLGSNYPEPGEYNQVNDEPALNVLLNLDVPLECAIVRYGKSSGTDAVRVTPGDMGKNMPGAGPKISPPVIGRHGGQFSTFGDYSINLFQNTDLYGDPPSRALFDMAAVAIVKNPDWATATEIPAPILQDGQWQERSENPRKIIIWENFDREAILADFFATMQDYVLVE